MICKKKQFAKKKYLYTTISLSSKYCLLRILPKLVLLSLHNTPLFSRLSRNRKTIRQTFWIESHEIKYNALLDSECLVVMVIYVSLEVWRNSDTKLMDIYCIVIYLYVKQPKRESWDRWDLLLWSQSMLYKDNTKDIIGHKKC